MIRFFILSIIIILYFSCYKKNTKDEFQCLYPLLDYNKLTTIDSTYLKKGWKATLAFNIDANLKKIGDLKFSPDFIRENDNISSKIRQSSINLDSAYVMRWNAYSTDICGIQRLLSDTTISDEYKSALEKSMIEKANMFYETVINTNHKPKAISEKRKTIQKFKNLESSVHVLNNQVISIHLDKKFGRYTSIFLDGLQIETLSSSSPFNPKVNLILKTDNTHKIIIYTKNNYRCELFQNFSPSNNLPKRFVPDCKLNKNE